MKFKLDENIGTEGKDILEAAGFDVMTIAELVFCRRRMSPAQATLSVMAAQAATQADIHLLSAGLGPRLRGDDD